MRAAPGQGMVGLEWPEVPAQGRLRALTAVAAAVSARRSAASRGATFSRANSPGGAGATAGGAVLGSAGESVTDRLLAR